MQKWHWQFFNFFFLRKFILFAFSCHPSKNDALAVWLTSNLSALWGSAPATLAEDPQQRQLQETRLHQFRGTQNQLFLLQHPGSKLYYFCLPWSNLVVSGGVMHLAKGALRCCGHEDIGDQKKPQKNLSLGTPGSHWLGRAFVKRC